MALVKSALVKAEAKIQKSCDEPVDLAKKGQLLNFFHGFDARISVLAELNETVEKIEKLRTYTVRLTEKNKDLEEMITEKNQRVIMSRICNLLTFLVKYCRSQYCDLNIFNRFQVDLQFNFFESFGQLRSRYFIYVIVIETFRTFLNVKRPSSTSLVKNLSTFRTFLYVKRPSSTSLVKNLSTFRTFLYVKSAFFFKPFFLNITICFLCCLLFIRNITFFETIVF